MDAQSGEAAYLGTRHSLIENDIRPTAVGRKRWLFIGHPDAGWRSAVAYTLIVSCRRRVSERSNAATPERLKSGHRG
jgi:hypothetical protein